MQAQALEGRWMRKFLLKPAPRTCSGELNLTRTYLRLALGEYLAPSTVSPIVSYVPGLLLPRNLSLHPTWPVRATEALRNEAVRLRER